MIKRCALLLLATALCAQAPAYAVSGAELAEAENDRGKEHYGKGTFSSALAAFERAYNTHPDPRYLCNMGRTRGKLAEIAANPAEKKALLVRARANVDTCLVKILADQEIDAARRERLLNKNTRLRNKILAALKEATAQEKAAAAAKPAPLPVTPEKPTTVKKLALAPDPTPKSEAPKTSLYKKWWIWTIVGVVVAGGVTAAAVAASSVDNTVPTGPVVDY